MIKVWACCLLLIPLRGTAPLAGPPSRVPPLTSGPRFSALRAALRSQIDAGDRQFRAGRYQVAQEIFETVLQQAQSARLFDLAARARGDIGGCQFARREYRPALASYLEARTLAARAGDTSEVALLDTNLASLYSEMGDLDTAAGWMQDALERVQGGDRVHLPAMLIQLATLRARQNRRTEARELFRRGIDSADRAGNVNLYSIGWNRVGEEDFKQGDLAAADFAFGEAFRVRKLNRLPLASSYRNLGRLRLQQGDIESASHLLDRYVELSEAPGGAAMPAWDVYQSRGRVRLAQGRLREALQDFRKAVPLARAWRAQTPSAAALRIGAEGMLDQVYAGLIEAGNRLYLETHDGALVRETFQAAEENRAGSLLAETAGDSSDLPSRVQSALGIDSALLSFHLGDTLSWMWAVDRRNISLSVLPPRRAIESQVRRALSALEEDRSDSRESLAALYDTLFGTLAPRYLGKDRWLVSLDQGEHAMQTYPSGDPGLYNVPLAALVSGDSFVAERRGTVVIPGARYWLAAPARAPESQLFVGVGDAIYNTADPRMPAPVPNGSRDMLPRLVASGAELDACSRAWHGDALLLKGAEACRDRLERALRRSPAVVHLATHIVAARSGMLSGVIGLSLDRRGENEWLQPADIAAWRLQGPLVVLSGCHSARGAALPGTGLLGLTRAWLAAGARTVIASHWNTTDESGDLFSALYRSLRGGDRPDAAEALRRAQLEMIRAGGWRARPHYWGAYGIVGKP